jgi:hypothetical protein
VVFTTQLTIISALYPMLGMVGFYGLRRAEIGQKRPFEAIQLPGPFRKGDFDLIMAKGRQFRTVARGKLTGRVIHAVGKNS